MIKPKTPPRGPGRPTGEPCPFACGKRFKNSHAAELHANGAHRTPHPRTELVHGTVAGYRKEIRWGLRTCSDCRAVWRAYMRRWTHKGPQGGTA